MGKIITVCGGHGSGKTTVAANLGYILSQNNLVGILSTNMVYGSIQHLFGTVIDDCHGLYEMSLSKYDTAKTFVPCLNNKNLFLMSLANSHDCLMLADEENGINGERAKEILSELKEMFQYLIVDCEPEINNPLSVYSIIYADKIINLIKPTITGTAFFNSYRSLYSALEIPDNKIIHVANNDKNYVGIKNVEKTVGLKMFLTIPHYKNVEQTENKGQLACFTKHGYFYDIRKIADRIKESASDE